MLVQLNEKDEGSDYACKIKQQVRIFVVMGPLHPVRRFMRKRRQEPVEIITADAGKKNEPEKIVRIGKSEHMTCLPGHQYGAKGNINAAEEKKIEDFPKQVQVVLVVEQDDHSCSWGIAFSSRKVCQDKTEIDTVILIIIVDMNKIIIERHAEFRAVGIGNCGISAQYGEESV